MTLKGIRHLISRTNFLGIELVTNGSIKRMEICFDEDYMRASDNPSRNRLWMDLHILSLYYDSDALTWVVWNATYEEYCGEFWALLEIPERTIPGAWVA